MDFFGFKISNPMAGEVVSAVKQGKDDIIIEQLNQLEDDLKIGNFVFITLGGDKVAWDKGLIGLASITQAPFDKGYDETNARNFKLRVKMELVLSKVIKREEFIPYKDVYDAAGIGPNTKGEQNQAIKSLTGKQAIAILRAMVERENQLLEKVKTLFDKDFTDKILGKLPILVLNSLSYGEKAPVVSDDASVSEVKSLTGDNIILYGVPGAGKSHAIEEQFPSDDEHVERVVFHPDYTYSDFVGQIMPKIKDGTDKLEYKFVEGPFTKIMRKAYDKTQESFYLIIEEINRGNAPAIFGDVFQLLDRKDDGTSKYGITNQDIAEAVYGSDGVDKKVKLPANLSIIATMNTADQSVFTLDTAFKRRWSMRLIPNDVKKCKFADAKILDTDVTWATFVTIINDLVLSENSDLTSTEDKRIGAYFVKRKDIELIDGEYNPAFAEKVLMYLWNDVFKFSRDTVFNEKYNALDKLIKGFETEKLGVFNIDFKVEAEGNESDES
jgi:5-methylcytosine-specific restriction endonuclease McrBC GTP-binding regulatory subunit McrB